MTNTNTSTGGRHLRAAIAALLIAAVVFGALALFNGTTPAADADPPTLTATGADTNVDEGVAVMPFSGASVTTLAVGEGITTLVVTVDIEEGNSERLQFNGASMQLNDLNSAVGGTVTGTVAQFGGSSGIATVTFAFSPAADALTVETFIDALEYRHVGNVPTEGDRAPTITSITHDAGTPGTTADDETAALAVTSRVTVIGVNDDPGWSELPTDITVAENTASPVDLRPIPASTPPFRGAFGDIDAQNFDITLTLVVDAGTLTGVDTGGVVATGNGTATLVLTGRSIDINNYLGTAANIQYTGPVGLSGDDAATLTPTANDGGNTGTGGGDDVAFAAINIDIEPTPVLTVCVVKILGDNAGQTTMPGDARFGVVVNGVALDGQLQPTAGNQNCSAPQGAGAASFEVPAGASFTITEADTTPGVGPVAISCDVFEIEQSDRSVGGQLATRSVTVDLEPSENQVDCTFVNETIPVCVSKRFDSGAETLIDAGMASIEDVEFALDDGPSEVPGFDCNEIPSIEYFVAPGSTFTITETIADGSPMRPVEIRCFQGETAVGIDHVGTASVTVATSVEQLGTIRCTFINDALIVCVTKTLDNDAAAFTMPGNFAFDLTPVGGPEQQLVPTPEDPLCDGGQNGPGVAALGVVGVALPPGTAFSIAEQDPGPQFGLVDAYCFAVESPFELTEDESLFELTEGTSTIEVPALEGISSVDCVFRNESVRVCVTKQVGVTASQADFTNAGISFTATVDGVVAPQTTGDENPCDDGGDDDYFLFYVAPGTTVELTETLPAGSPLGLLAPVCVESEGSQNIGPRLAGQTVVFGVSDVNVDCTLTNEIGVVCVTKTVLAGAEMAGYTAAEFGFDVTFDGETAPEMPEQWCESSETTSQAVTGFAYRPYSDVTVREVDNSTNPLPNALESAQCQAGEDDPVFNDPGSESVTVTDVDGNISCEFRNDTLILCVAKIVGPTGLAGGFTPADFGFTVVDGGTTIESFSTECGPTGDAIASYAYALAPDDSGTVTITETSTPADAAIGLVRAQCQPGLNVSTDLAARSVVSPKQHGGNSVLNCVFVNDSVAVTITKSVVNDDGGTATASDFVFDVFDQNGAAIKSDLRTGAVVYVAPRVAFTVSERASAGYTASGTCSDVGVQAPAQALAAAASVTHTAAVDVDQVVCTFVNDDIAPIPVCALLIFEEGSTGFTLDDFSLELFKDGALIGQRSAGDPFDAACEDTTDNTAQLLPGSLVQLGKVFADGSSFAFAVSIADPDELLVFEPLSCSVDAPAATQALAGADPVTFTVDPGTTRVNCVARANEKPLVIGSGGGLPGGRPPYVEPVVAAAAAAPAPEAAQVVAVAVAAPAPIAVTGSSTTGVTLPAAFGLLSAGFVGLGLDRRRRRNRNELG